MKRQIQQLIRLDSTEKKVLVRMAELQKVSQSDILRLAMQREAKRRGLWPQPVKGVSK